VASSRPDPFQDTFVSAIAARAVIAATRLGVFDALGERAQDASELAERLDLDPVGVEALLPALASLGYLTAKADGRHRLTPEAARLLVRSSPDSIATFVGEFNAHQWDAVTGLEGALRGEAVAGWHARPQGPEFWESYIRGLFEVSRAEQDANAAVVPLEDARDLLDVAGGHGGFAMAMCRRYPRLAATVIDLSESAGVGRRIVEEEGYADRVEFVEGDAFEADLGSGRDVVSAFNLVHHLPEERVALLLGRFRAALGAGGAVVIGDTERPAPGSSATQIGALMGLGYFAASRAHNYSAQELEDWLLDAGFGDVRVHRNERSPWRIVLVARS
jgi:SAM-dependent methyltransferase/DNA-binding transcriptional ArsR family regulator